MMIGVQLDAGGVGVTYSDMIIWIPWSGAAVLFGAAVFLAAAVVVVALLIGRRHRGDH